MRLPKEIRYRIYEHLMAWSPLAQYPCFEDPTVKGPVRLARRVKRREILPLIEIPWWWRKDLANNTVHSKLFARCKDKVLSYELGLGLFDYFKREEYEHLVQFMLALEKSEPRRMEKTARMETGILPDFLAWFWTEIVLDFHAYGEDHYVSPNLQLNMFFSIGRSTDILK
jgi:hypothetical protein